MSLNSHITLNFNKQRRQESRVNTPIKLCSGGMNHSRGRKFFSSKKHPYWIWSPSSLLPQGQQGLFLWVPYSRDLANMSTLSPAAEQNTYMWLYFCPLIQPHNMHRGNFTSPTVSKSLNLWKFQLTKFKNYVVLHQYKFFTKLLETDYHGNSTSLNWEWQCHNHSRIWILLAELKPESSKGRFSTDLSRCVSQCHS